ncbi:MAG: enoyl-CoA hydratase/isomerase family protein [Gemmatimonadota bacterium]|nr:MAG: enoyl-CoA hydratase/isomerase family protein [Gemmatimonadota bacterium]
MSADRVLVDLSGGVLTLTLNRPEKRNALDSTMVSELQQQLDRAELDAEVKVVVVRGAGKDFCAGADLAELLESVDQSPDDNAAHAQRLGNVFVTMRKLPKSVVAVVEGRALAGGCGLATACDLVLAHAEASFGYPEVKRGFVPAMVIAMLHRAVGEKVAYDLVGTGHVLTAAEALRVGLVSRVIAADGFDAAVDEIVQGMAASSPSAVALIKRQLYEVEGRSFEEAIALGAKVNAVARATPDFKAAVAKFLQK